MFTVCNSPWKIIIVLAKMTDKEGSGADQALGIESEETEKGDEEPKLEKKKVLLKLKRENRLRKTEMTKIRHHMEKLCIAPKDVSAVEQDIEQLWSLLERNIGNFGRIVCCLFGKRRRQESKGGDGRSINARNGHSSRHRESPRGRESTRSNYCSEN